MIQFLAEHSVGLVDFWVFLSRGGILLFGGSPTKFCTAREGREGGRVNAKFLLITQSRRGGGVGARKNRESNGGGNGQTTTVAGGKGGGVALYLLRGAEGLRLSRSFLDVPKFLWRRRKKEDDLTP